MPDSKAVQLVIQSGMIPEEMLQQLVTWKLLPEEVKDQAGSRPVSLEQGWQTVEEFVDTLGRAIDKESVEIKETLLSSGKRYERVDLIHDGASVSELAMVEGSDCIVVPATGRKHPHQAMLDGVKREVWKVEERFFGDELTTLVCYLKPVLDVPAQKEE